jgi:hypothetical protein
MRVLRVLSRTGSLKRLGAYTVHTAILRTPLTSHHPRIGYGADVSLRAGFR